MLQEDGLEISKSAFVVRSEGVALCNTCILHRWPTLTLLWWINGSFTCYCQVGLEIQVLRLASMINTLTKKREGAFFTTGEDGILGSPLKLYWYHPSKEGEECLSTPEWELKSASSCGLHGYHGVWELCHYPTVLSILASHSFFSNITLVAALECFTNAWEGWNLCSPLDLYWWVLG